MVATSLHIETEQKFHFEYNFNCSLLLFWNVLFREDIWCYNTLYKEVQTHIVSGSIALFG